MASYLGLFSLYRRTRASNSTSQLRVLCYKAMGRTRPRQITRIFRSPIFGEFFRCHGSRFSCGTKDHHGLSMGMLRNDSRQSSDLRILGAKLERKNLPWIAVGFKTKVVSRIVDTKYKLLEFDRAKFFPKTLQYCRALSVERILA